MERWPSGGRDWIQPTLQARNAIYDFHTHPNYGTGGGGIKGPSPNADVPSAAYHQMGGFIVDKESYIYYEGTGEWREIHKR